MVMQDTHKRHEAVRLLVKSQREERFYRQSGISQEERNHCLTLTLLLHRLVCLNLFHPIPSPFLSLHSFTHKDRQSLFLTLATHFSSRDTFIVAKTACSPRVCLLPGSV